MSHPLPPCRSCASNRLALVLSLGDMPLANSLLTMPGLDQVEEKFPLDLAFCPDCSLVQITVSVSPEKLFREYLYFSSYSDTMLRHSKSIADRLIESRGLDGSSMVIEIASNDGYLLQFYQQHSIPVLGIEPAVNIACVAESRGIPTLTEFFGEDLADTLCTLGKYADVIHANNVMAHVPDLNGVVSGIARVLKPDGIAVIETPYVKNLVENCEFDTIYHEHLCYYSLCALDHLFKRHGLTIYDVEYLPIHGGSLRIYASRHETRWQSVLDMLHSEAASGITGLGYYQDFALRVEGLKTSLRSVLFDMKNECKRIAAYGAAAKGSTLLNYAGINTDTIDFVVDRSPHKQGRYMPGVHIPIHAPQKLLTDMPDYVLLLAWNFADEIMGQQAEYRRRGGRFIIPVPEVNVV